MFTPYEILVLLAGSAVKFEDKMESDIRDKIMIISNSISGGGAEISMVRLSTTLKAMDVRIQICALNKSESAEISQDGIMVIGREWGSGLFATLRNLVKFRQHVKNEDPDILLVNCELPELYVSLCAPRRSKLFVVEHTSRPWHGRKLLGVLVRTNLLFRRARWITVSRDKSPIWPYSIKPIFIPNSHIQPSQPDGRFSADLVFVGRLNRGKHPEIVALAAQQTDSTADFFGDGPEMISLKQDYSTKSIKFHGFVNEPWSQISPKSIVIIASEFEGDGMNVVEAVANGNPILLAENADLRRFNFPDVNYFKSIEDLISKIEEAKKIGTEYLSIPNTIRAKILIEREPNRVAGQWIDLFNGGTGLCR
jgi:glycosyltransferase involved in cell wall biosynthesis